MKISFVSCAAWLTYALIVVPLVMVIGASFTETRFITFPPQGFTFRWYDAALNDKALMGGLGLSAIVALAAVAISVVLGTLGALYLSRTAGRVKEIVSAFFLAPLNVPAVMTAFALLLAFTQWHLINVWGLVIAHAVLTLPYIVRSVLVSLAGQDPAIERAGAILGASPWRVFRHITLPLIRPGIVAGGTFAFLISFNNVPISVFLASPGSAPLPVVLFNRMQWLAEPSVAAAATLTVVTTLVVMLVLERRFSFYKSLFR
ncbi:ABC transporter permease [Ramlibacter sp.]|uniref:ABC transporter permease n=1 Tax=Ramlibacter sp. TaxID=1917967 RepID=UPI003D10391B